MLSAFDLNILSSMNADAFPLSGTIYLEDGETELDILPDMPGSEMVRKRHRAYAPEVTVQKLYRLPVPEAYTSAALDKELAVLLFTQVLDAFEKPETQVGYTYHSSRKDKDIPLFEESYISNKKGRKQDSFRYHSQDLPLSFEYYQFVDEANFSGTVLQQRVEVTKEYFSFQSTNTERMWVSIIPVLGSEGMRNEMLMTLHDTWLYVYNCTQVKEEPSAAKTMGLPIHLPSMFGKRMDVMAQWLTDRLHQ
jgi:hypothetical protein